jgi:hypothetical protein
VTVSSETKNAPTPPMSAPGGLARRLCGDASVHAMSATTLRNHLLLNNLARHRSLRRAMASASAKMPRTCIVYPFQSELAYTYAFVWILWRLDGLLAHAWMPRDCRLNVVKSGKGHGLAEL